MGYLTTFTVYNDSAGEFLKEENREHVCNVLYQACLGVQLDKGINWDSLGNHCNAFILQKPRHANDPTIYFHLGNTVVCLDELKTSSMKDAAINLLEFYLEKLKNE